MKLKYANITICFAFLTAMLFVGSESVEALDNGDCCCQKNASQVNVNESEPAFDSVPTDDECNDREMIPIDKQEKILVVYFSVDKDMTRVAKATARAVGADLYEIVPAKPYTRADLNFRFMESRVNKELSDSNIIPKIAGKDVKNWNNYTTVMIGYPVWSGKAPNIVRGFVKNHDFKGKAVVPFCTSSDSMGDSTMILQGDALNRGIWLRGECFDYRIPENCVEDWARGLLNGDGPVG